VIVKSAQSGQIAAALRQISRGYAALADAIGADPSAASDEERSLALIEEWGGQGLDRPRASALFRRHGFSPQASGGWSRGGWLEIRDDGLRYLTARSSGWAAENAAGDV